MASSHESVANRWEDIKPTFLRLYHDEQRTLDEVRNELEKSHHFIASKSAFTRQIRKWNAFKNYKVSEKQRLVSQRIRGQEPKVDLRGQPIKWDRVYRGTRKQMDQKQSRRSDVAGPGVLEPSKKPSPVIKTFPEIVNQDSHVLSFVVDIWRHSTFQFASKDPSAPSYQVARSLYTRLMQSMAVITQSAKPHWPKREIDSICNAIPTLVKIQPAMVCDILSFLTTHDPQQNFAGCKPLKDQLFDYIRNMARKVLPEANALRRLISNICSREDLTRLGAAIAKAKLDMMWNSQVVEPSESQHHRSFFRQVLIKAIIVVMDYGELECACAYLKKVSFYDSQEPFYLAACERLRAKQSIPEELMNRSNDDIKCDDASDVSEPELRDITM